MPITVDNPLRNKSSDRVVAAVSKNLGYSYPEGLRLKPGSPQHEKILCLVMERGRISWDHMQKRVPIWDKTDKTLTAYIDLSTEEKALKKSDPKAAVSVVIPYSYAAMETILTYLVMAFLNQVPILQYEAVSNEDVIAIKKGEILVQRQLDYYKGSLALHTMLRDGLAYGIGACAPVWRTEMQFVKTPGQMTETLGGLPVRGADTVENRVVFEGTDLTSIGPRYLLLDPNRSVHTFQRGEHVGWVEETNIYQVLEQERANKNWFNGRYLSDCGPTTSYFHVSKELYSNTNQSKPTTLVHMYVTILPKEYDLPGAPGNTNGDYPEKWIFTVADDWCIVRAERCNASHGKYPMVLNAPDFDGYSAYPLSRLDVIAGLQDTLNFLFNSHIANVRKVINNTLIVDPSIIDVASIQKAKEGGIALKNRSAWGTSIKDAVFQLPVSDVTSNHIRDASSIIDMMQRVSAATDNMMGMMRNQGERVSATESRSVATSASNRLEKIAKIISLQAFSDLGMMCITNTQDYMSQPVSSRILGRWPEELVRELGGQPGQNLVIEPADIKAPFDVIVRDGSLPMDVNGISNSWMQIFSQVTANPLLGQQFDVKRIFMHLARLLGAKNIQDFVLDGVVLPDETVAAEAQKGNLVSTKELPSGSQS